MKIGIPLLKSCENSRAHYEQYLQKKRDEEELERKRKEEKDARSKVEDELAQLKRDKDVIKKGIEIAEKSIESGNAEMGTLIRSNVFKREKLIGAQCKIEMGVKRKAELLEEMKVIDCKIAKLE